MALHFTNGFELAVVYYACFEAGLVAVPLNTRMKGAELAYVLNHSGARIYLDNRAFTERSTRRERPSPWTTSSSAATAAILRDGWLGTGDLARVDEDGYYWFVGRKKEIIIRGGSNISPLEVEEALYQHPAIREVGVVGAPSQEPGEIVLAFASLKTGAEATELDLKTFLAPRMAAYKIPERIVFVPELPKGLTGKVHRKTLREWATANC